MPGERVVEGDHQREGGKRIEEEVLREGVDRDVPGYRERRDRGGREPRRPEPRVNRGEHGGERTLPRHRERGARRRDDRRLRRRHRRRDDREDDELVPRRAEHVGRECTEDPFVVVVLGEQLEPRIRDHGRRDEHVRDDEDDGAHERSQPGRPGAVACLLGEVDRALPAPVDEDPEQECRDERREALDRERREPVRLRPGRAVRRVAGVDLAERDEGEDEQDQRPAPASSPSAAAPRAPCP